MRRIALLSCISLFAACVSENKSGAPRINETEVNPAIDTMHAANSTLDWPGHYLGYVPCADCDSTKVEVTINPDNTFVLKMDHIGNKNEQIQDQGSIAWEQNDSYIRLKGSRVDYYFRLGDDEITLLQDIRHIPEESVLEDYSLEKQEQYPTHDKHQQFPVE